VAKRTRLPKPRRLRRQPFPQKTAIPQPPDVLRLINLINKSFVIFKDGLSLFKEEKVDGGDCTGGGG